MFVFFDGAIASAVVLFVALVLGAYAERHPDWWVFSNDYAAMALAVGIACALVVGGVMSGIAGAEHQLSLFAWIGGYAAIQAIAELMFRLVRPLLFRRERLAVT